RSQSDPYCLPCGPNVAGRECFQAEDGIFIGLLPTSARAPSTAGCAAQRSARERQVMSDLPIHAVLPDLLASLRTGSNAVLVAPPGAGKTTAVAPALLYEDWCDGQVLLLSPRRLAARAAAERIAEQLGEKPGGTVG